MNRGVKILVLVGGGTLAAAAALALVAGLWFWLGNPFASPPIGPVVRYHVNYSKKAQAGHLHFATLPEDMRPAAAGARLAVATGLPAARPANRAQSGQLALATLPAGGSRLALARLPSASNIPPAQATLPMGMQPHLTTATLPPFAAGSVTGSASLASLPGTARNLPAIAPATLPKFLSPELSPATLPNMASSPNIPAGTGTAQFAFPLIAGRSSSQPPSRPEARFVMAMCRDHAGNIWLATEGSGVCRYNPGALPGKHRTWFTAARLRPRQAGGGLCDSDIYALACDNRGRVWAGTLNHGVCVYNGQRWQDYGIAASANGRVLAGPLGCRVFALKFNPRTEQMWICTDAGISVYQCGGTVGINATAHKGNRGGRALRYAPHTWHYITRADGLPANPEAVAFGKRGTVYVGTQCSGIAISTLAESYKKWKVIAGPLQMPLTATGRGLPSGLVNSVCAVGDGKVVVGTDGGVAFGSDQGTKWRYERGQDLPAKIRGLWHAPKHWKAPSAAILAALPLEDYTTVVANQQIATIGADPASTGSQLPSPDSRLWLGHWRRGLDIYEMSSTGAAGTAGQPRARWSINSPEFGRYITSLLPLPGGAMAVGTYGHGAKVLILPGASDAWGEPGGRAHAGTAAHSVGRPARATPLPRAAKAPGEVQIFSLLKSVVLAGPPTGGSLPDVVPISDNWRTQGTWLGRYGRYWSCLFACCSPGDYVWGPGPLVINHIDTIGPHHSKGDSVRYWVHWLATTNKRSLELPEVYLDSRVVKGLTPWGVDRRESELDDHSEAYSTAWQGPGLYVLLQVPPGSFALSLYFFNKDGQTGLARNRDYRLSLIPLPESYPFYRHGEINVVPLAHPGRAGMATKRVLNFWGGVWKRYWIHGPMKLAIHVSRNHSFCAILNGAFLDPLAQHPEPYYYSAKAWQIRQMNRRAARKALLKKWRTEKLMRQANSDRGFPLLTGQLLLRCLNLLEHCAPARWAVQSRRDYTLLLRWVVAKYGTLPKKPRAAVIAETCYYQLHRFRRWEAVEKSLGVITSRQIEKRLRWNRYSDSYRGMEARVIRKEVKKLKAARAAGTNGTTQDAKTTKMGR